MLITDDFVFLEFPKSGSTFSREVISRVYKYHSRPCRYLRSPNLLNPLEVYPIKGYDPRETQHGFYCQIPPQHLGKPVVSTIRHPYELLLSEYHYRTWRTDYIEPALAQREFPHFPELSFAEFIEFSNFMVRHRLLTVYHNPAPPPLGLMSLRFILMFYKDPYAVLKNIDDAYIDAMPHAQQAEVTFLRQSHLREDLINLLHGYGMSEESLQFIREKPAVKTTCENQLSDWPQDTELTRLVARNERLLLRHPQMPWGDSTAA